MEQEMKSEEQELNEQQLEFLSGMKSDRYGGYGAFVGMCLSQSMEFGKNFFEVVRLNVDARTELDRLIEEHRKAKVEKEVEDTPVF